MKSGEKLYERQYLSPRPPPKISLRHDLNWNKDKIRVLQLNIDQSGNSFNSHLEKQFNLVSSKPTQSPKPIEDRSGRPVTQEIVSVLQEELSSSDRSEKPRDRGRTTCPRSR